MCVGGRPPTRFIKALLLVGKFDCSELCRQIDNELNNTVEILNGVNNDDVNTNNIVESASIRITILIEYIKEN